MSTRKLSMSAVLLFKVCKGISMASKLSVDNSFLVIFLQFLGQVWISLTIQKKKKVWFSLWEVKQGKSRKSIWLLWVLQPIHNNLIHVSGSKRLLLSYRVFWIKFWCASNHQWPFSPPSQPTKTSTFSPCDKKDPRHKVHEQPNPIIESHLGLQ